MAAFTAELGVAHTTGPRCLAPAAGPVGAPGPGLAVGVLRRTVRLRPGLPLVVQWALWGWACLSRVVSDGTATVVPFLKDD